MSKQTPSQTVGPFYAIGLTRTPMNVMLPTKPRPTDSHRRAGLRRRRRADSRRHGGIWQANAYGRYNHPDDKQEKPFDPAFTGWGRSGTDENCFYRFDTIKPGPVPGATTRCRRRISTWSFSRAACWCMPTREFISATSRRTTAIRC